eukprot:514477-Rhodomonas_salina.1
MGQSLRVLDVRVLPPGAGTGAVHGRHDHFSQEMTCNHGSHIQSDFGKNSCHDIERGDGVGGWVFE